MALGRSLLQAGEWEQAAAALDKAIELEPRSFWPNFYQGVCAYRQKRFEGAVVAFRVCVALAPDHAECYYNRALAHAALGRKDQAASDYGRALQRDPSLWTAALNRGLIYFEQKRYAEALADMQHALAHGGDPALVHYNIALLHLEQGDRTTARASASAPCKLTPSKRTLNRFSSVCNAHEPGVNKRIPIRKRFPNPRLGPLTSVSILVGVPGTRITEGSPMLILTRKLGECIHIGAGMKLTVVAIDGQRIRLGIDAQNRSPCCAVS